jgi:rhamnose transport system permease protein
VSAIAFARRGGSKLALLAGLWSALVVGLVIAAPAILQPFMATTVLQFSTILALVSLGQTMVVLGGGAGIDLSLGGNVSLTSVLAMALVRAGGPAALLPLFCIGIGALLGGVNGFLVTRIRLLPLIATLATLFIYGGLAVALTGGLSISGVPPWLTPLGRGSVSGVPIHFLVIALPAFGLGALILTQTAWGRWIYAMGHNERSARLVGVDVDGVRLTLYAVSGLLAGLAALVSLAWFGSARPNIGQNLELDSLAAILLGGVSISGGAGGVGGVLAAVLLIETLKTGLQFVNINSIWQVGIVGALLIVVLLADHLPNRRTS